MSQPLCFVLMPFGEKPGVGGLVINFDTVYDELIAPAIRDAGLEPIRADVEKTGGIIHKPIYERLLLCEYAVADLTTANANVFYELGVRHAVRPSGTVAIFAEGERLPFDVEPLRAIPYQLGRDGKPANIESARTALAASLRSARDNATDSPLFQLVEGMEQQSRVAHEKTDVFRDQVRYSEEKKEQLASARSGGRDAVFQIEQSLGDLAELESGVVIDLFLSYRAVSSWEDMIRVAGEMSAPLAQTAMVQEQLGMALNRSGDRDSATRVLEALLDRRGACSETLGILGRVYKDRWTEETKSESGSPAKARGYLGEAIETYLRGFETDWRDAYPGVNALTLMELKEPPDERRTDLLPVVRYAVQRKIAAGKPDYWDYATELELAVLGSDQSGALEALDKSLAIQREPWESGTTAKNLQLIQDTRARRGTADDWVPGLITELESAANS